MSNRSKGNAFEVRVKKYLEAKGFTVDKARAIQKQIFTPRGRFFVSSPNDFLGCADLLAVSKAKHYTLFVQCCASSQTGNVTARKKKLEAVPWNLQVQKVQLWQRVGKPGWIRVHEMDNHGEPWTFVDFHPTKNFDNIEVT